MLIGLGTLLAIHTASAPARRAAAAEPAPAPASYWGPLPAATDSGSVRRFRNNRLPVWEAAVVYPWRVVTFPIKVGVAGLGAGIVALDEGGVVKTLAHLIAPPPTLVGFTPSLNAGGANGFGLGGAFYDKHLPVAGSETQIRYEGTFRGAHKTSLGVRLGNVPGGQLDMVLGYRYRPYTRFYGLGPNSRRDDQTIYTQEIGWVGAAYRHETARHLTAEVEVLGSQILAGGTRFKLQGSERYLTDVFGAAPPVGYRRTSRGASIGFSLAHDETSETGRPERGGVRRATASWFESFGDEDADFWTFRLEAQQFLPLWFSKRALALRGFVSYIDPTGTDPIPYQRLNYNDTPDNLRGYREYRWRDRGLAVATAEYRWPIWADRVPDGAGLDMYLLTDLGQVFADFSQLTLPNLTVSYGGGFRFIGGQRGLAMRIEVARSREETQFRFRTDQLFQFMKEGLFFGRNPIPSR